MTPEERKKVQDTLLRSAEQVVRQMKSDAEVGNIDQLERSATKVAELTKQKEFPTQRAQEFQRTAKFIQREAYEHRVGDLLNELIHTLRTGRDEAKNDMLGKVREHVSAAVRFGADEDFRASVDRRLQVIQMTTGEGIDKRAKAEAARRTELRDTVCKAPGGVERREFLDRAGQRVEQFQSHLRPRKLNGVAGKKKRKLHARFYVSRLAIFLFTGKFCRIKFNHNKLINLS